MDRMLVTTVVVLCVSLSSSVTVPPGLELRCPSRYRVQAFDSNVVEFKVSDNKKGKYRIDMITRIDSNCNRLARKRHVKEVNNEMRPSITVVYKGGHYRANISWDFVLNGTRLPRAFLIDLTFYNIEDSRSPKYLSDTCVLLRLVGKRKIIASTVPSAAKFYFDCLPLLNEPDIGLVVKLWSYTKQKGFPCRSLRSISSREGPCGSSVQCSTNYSYPVSKNAHSYRQCACYIKHHGHPKLIWHYDYAEKRFQINITNVPPYLNHATIEIVDAMNDNRFTDIDIPVHQIQNGEINIPSDEFHPGKYTVYVCVKLKLYMECKDLNSMYKTEINDDCEYDGDYYISYPRQMINVSQHNDDSSFIPDKKTKHLETLLGIVGGVIFIAIVTTVVFIVCRCLRNKENTSSSCDSSGDQTLQSNPLMNDQNNSGANIETRLGPQGRSLLQSDPQTAEESFTQTNSEHSSSDRWQTMSGSTQPGAYQVMLLYHPDANNKEHNERVRIFSQTLTNTYGISLESKTTGNWQDFAESAFEKYKNVVLIISEDLTTLCHHYIHSKHSPENLLAERNQEIIPCIVLEQMHILMQQDPKPTDVAIHIVTLDNQTKVLQQFLQDHPFLTNENYYLYDFCDKNINSATLALLFSRFKSNKILDYCRQMMIDINMTDSL